jgi:outer membrane protein assembly factor BamA
LKKILLIILAALWMATPGMADAGEKPPSPVPTPAPTPSPAGTSDPEVLILQPTPYVAKKFYLFPLELPAYILKAATFPLISLSKFLEREGLIQFTPRDWILLPLIQAGGSWGFGGGLFFQYANIADTGYLLQADFKIFTDLDLKGGFQLRSPPVIYFKDRPVAYRVRARVRNRNDARFFGIGPGTPQSAESFYTYDQTWGGFDWEILATPALGFTVPVEFLTARTGPSRSSVQPSAQTVFPETELAGFDRRLNYFVFGLNLEYDTRSSQLTPNRGGYRAFRYSRFQGLNTTEFDFNQFEVDIRQFFELWSPRHVLAARTAWQFQQGDVPFYLLSILDWKNMLRGFTRGRFRDKAYALFNFEYRFPIWDVMDGNIFVDTGKVFNNPDNFNFNDWRYSVGGGISFFFRDIVLIGFQAGYGGEGAQLLFNFGPAI